MSQNTSVESSNRSLNQSIKPALQAALVSLDMQLEEELARYRRQKAGRPVMPPRGLGRHQVRKPLDLISVDKVGETVQRPALGMSTAPKISMPLTSVAQTPSPLSDWEPEREDFPQASQPSRVSSVKSGVSDAPIIPSSGNATTDRTPPTARMTERLPAPGPSESDLAAFADTQAQPEDYLESSEQLLRSLAEDEKSAEPQKRLTDKLLTPLGVGSILLLLLSTATLVYIFTNPSTLSALGLDRLFGSKQQSTAQSPSKITAVKSEPAPGSSALGGPKLDQGEFKDINPENLSQLEASSSPSSPPSPVDPLSDLPNPGVNSAVPPAASNSTAINGSSNLPSALLPRSLSPGTASQAPTGVQRVVPIPAPLAQPPVVSAPKPAAPENIAASPATSRNSFYYVLGNYSSLSDLAQAKRVVPDAYVEKFPQGARIQMGAFKRESEAKTLVEQLKQQGVTASIYSP